MSVTNTRVYQDQSVLTAKGSLRLKRLEPVIWRVMFVDTWGAEFEHGDMR